jgi:S-adenosylmethionine decarboxylase
MKTASDRIVSHRLSAVLNTPEGFDGSPTFLLDVLTSSVESAQLTPVAQTSAIFEPDGASAVVLLAESHIAVHYWPEYRKMTVDIHVCDYSGHNLSKARRLAQIVEKVVATETSSWQIDSIAG